MLLLAADRFCAAGVSWKRLLAAAAAGAVYSLMYVLLENVFGAAVVKMIVGALMLLIAFGGRRDFGRCAAVFLFCSAAFGGIVLAVSLCCGGFGTKQLVFSFAAAYALLGGILRFSGARGGTVKVELQNRGSSVQLTALRDTGCTLRDPATGGAVIIAEEESLLPLMEAELRAELRMSGGQRAERRLERLWDTGLGRGFRLLPYTSVGVEDGLLLAFSPERVLVDGKEVKGISAALAPGKLSGGEFTAIINADQGGRI